MVLRLAAFLACFVTLSYAQIDCETTLCSVAFEPVCGTDGVTYNNTCVAECQNEAEVACDGPCPCPEETCEPQFCTLQYNPVCGSDGLTYSNPCRLENAKCNNPELVQLKTGACDEPEPTECEQQFCIFIFAPVCGSNGVTYSNACALENAQCGDAFLFQVSEGECEGNGDDSGNGGGLGNDGFVGGLGGGNDGDDQECGQFCALVFNPVCGSDGMTYSNPCALDNAQCEDPFLFTIASGVCEDENDDDGDDSFGGFAPFLLEDDEECEELFCALIFDPVCGSDGNTYGNPCALANAQCLDPELVGVRAGVCAAPDNGGADNFAADPFLLQDQQQETLPPIVPDIPEPEEEECDQVFCISIFDPVCGSDGNTYSNPCALGNAQCLNPELVQVKTGVCDAPDNGNDGNDNSAPFLLQEQDQQTVPPLVPETEEPCDQVFCISIFDPVCGSDGNTYSNPCALGNAQCLNPELVQVKTGVCDDNGSDDDDSTGGFAPFLLQDEDEDAPCEQLFCIAIFDPVCGSDGNTYSNPCALTNAQCNNPELTQVKTGACDPPETEAPCEPQFCTFVFDPVCGSDGNTYSNACILSNAQCENPELTQVKTGTCDEEEPSEPLPSLCGGAFNTPCPGENQQCVDGVCEEVVCPFPICEEIYFPVCGTDGVTYENMCMFDYAKCLSKGELSVSCIGPCPQNGY